MHILLRTATKFLLYLRYYGTYR
ncbi:hypothetical protein LINGRAHAP2_LOCUS24217 [Linum grandiflorum]